MLNNCHLSADIIQKQFNSVLSCFYFITVATFAPRSKIPVSNSVTALEIWLLTCVMLVFLSLAEYSLILWDGVKRRNDTQRKLEVGEQ